MTGEFVLARCRCGWESEPVAVNSESPNGEWFARQKASIEYRSHFDSQHRPLPTYVNFTAEHSGSFEHDGG